MAHLSMPGGSPVLKLTRSAHNLSNKTLFDVEQNTLVPTAVYDVVPGDKFNLGSSALIRTTALIKPAFTIDLEAKSISAYCSYRTLWKPFEDFFSGGRTGNSKVPLPVFTLCHKTTNNGMPYNILDYFDLPSRSSNPGEFGGNEKFMLNALYLLAYLKIWNDLFRNPTLDIEIDVYNLTIYLPGDDTPYKFNPNFTVTFVYNGTSYTHIEVSLFLYWCFSLISQTVKPGDLRSATLEDGYVSSFPGTGTDDGFRLMPAIVNLPRDLFTSALPTASGPNEVSLGLSGAVSNKIFKENIYTDFPIKSSPGDVAPGIPIVDTSGYVSVKPAVYQEFLINNGGRKERAISGANLTVPGGRLHAHVLSNWLNGMVNSENLLNISGIYPRELRLVFGLDLKNQIRNLTGNRYKDLTKAFYGIDIQDYRVQMAEYIGGNKYPIYTSEILQTSESQSTPLGDQAGHQIASGVGKHGSYFVRELGCILNLFWINSSLPYTQCLRRDWCKFSVNDFFFSMFEKLGDQEILQHELSFFFNPNNTDNIKPNFRIFGFTPRYSEYKFYNHTCKGGFRGNYRYWTQSRFFIYSGSDSALPVLSSEFIKPDLRSVNRIYQTISADYTLKPYQVKFENRTIAFRPMEENTLGYLIDHF
nr:MAG: major capsid protein [Microviridae sp.]